MASFEKTPDTLVLNWLSVVRNRFCHGKNPDQFLLSYLF